MPTTLITGMSATGKSSVIEHLLALGHRAVDLDTHEWPHAIPDDSHYANPTMDRPVDWRWRENDVRALLGTAAEGMLFVAGTSTDQARFYPLIDHVVVLTVPADIAVQRLARRAEPGYGAKPSERQRELELREHVGPFCADPPALRPTQRYTH